MKKFDLEKALAGEPFQDKRTKHKFYYLGDASKLGSELIFPIVLYNATTDETINIAIEHFIDENYGMWEEPPPTVTLTLPCPLKEIEEGQEFWRITINSDPLSIAWAKVDVGMSVFDKENVYHLALLDAGLAFKSEEDAQAWFDAMKNARR